MSVPTPRRRVLKPQRNRRNRRPLLETLEPRMLLATIQGTLFEDLNGDGVRTPEDPALQMPGITVFLDQNQNGVLETGEDSRTTDANGYYEFTGLPVGDYTVAQLVPADWLQTTPTPAAASSQLGSVLENYDLSAYTDYPCGLARNEDTGTLYLVVNGTGIYPIDPATGSAPAGSTGFALPTPYTWDITIDNAGNFWGTDGSANLIVQFRQSLTDSTQSEVLQQFPIPYTDVSDPYPVGVAWDSTDSTIWVLDRLTEKVYHISPSDGSLLPEAFDAPGSEGTLFGLTFDGAHLWTNRWDDGGAANRTYEFERSGQLLRSFAPPFAHTGHATGIVFGGTNEEGKESLWIAQRYDERLFQVDITTPGAHSVTLESSEDTRICDFGDFRLATISGTVFEDLDQDGERDPGEVGLQGWQVFLDVNDDGQAAIWEDTVLTDENGNFQIAHVAPGDYPARLIQREPGWLNTSANTLPLTIEQSSGQSLSIVYGQYLGGVGPYGGEIAASEDTVGVNLDGGQVIASDAVGNFAITWPANGPQDPDGLGVYVRVFDAYGTPRTGDILVNQSTAGDQTAPSIAMADDGHFVVVWNDACARGWSLLACSTRTAPRPETKSSSSATVRETVRARSPSAWMPSATSLCWYTPNKSTTIEWAD